jgi:hypothetical protein
MSSVLTSLVYDAMNRALRGIDINAVAVVIEDADGKRKFAQPRYTDSCRSMVHYLNGRDKTRPNLKCMTSDEQQNVLNGSFEKNWSLLPEDWSRDEEGVNYPLIMTRLAEIQMLLQDMTCVGSPASIRPFKETLKKKFKEHVLVALMRLLEEEFGPIYGKLSEWVLLLNSGGIPMYEVVGNTVVFLVRSRIPLADTLLLNTREVTKAVTVPRSCLPDNPTNFTRQFVTCRLNKQDFSSCSSSFVLETLSIELSGPGRITVMPGATTIETHGKHSHARVRKSSPQSEPSSSTTSPKKREREEPPTTSQTEPSSSPDTPPVKRHQVNGVSSSSSSASSSSSSSSSSTSSSPDTPPVKRQKVDKGPSASSSSSSSSPSTTSPKKREREEPPLCLDPSCPDRNSSVTEKRRRLGAEWRVSTNGQRLYHNTQGWVAEYDLTNHWIHGREKDSVEELKRHW